MVHPDRGETTAVRRAITEVRPDRKAARRVLKALAAAKERGLTTVFLTGERGRGEAARWDVGVVVPSAETAKVMD